MPDAQFRMLLEAIQEHGAHHWLEIAYWLSQIALTIAAVATAIFAGVQLKQIRRESEARTAQMKADFLFRLDQMFESAPIAEARIQFMILYKTVEETVRGANPHIAHEALENAISVEYARMLHELREQKIEQYASLMKLTGFFETVGCLVSDGIVEDLAIRNLYGGTIKQIWAATRVHVGKRQQDMHPGYLENFRKLAEQN